jgi:hypothetical protein
MKNILFIGLLFCGLESFSAERSLGLTFTNGAIARAAKQNSSTTVFSELIKAKPIARAAQKKCSRALFLRLVQARLNKLPVKAILDLQAKLILNQQAELIRNNQA